MTNLKHWRESLEFDIDQMSRFLGIPRNTYRNWEKGIRQPGAAGESLIELLAMMEVICPDVFNMRIGQAKNGASA